MNKAKDLRDQTIDELKSSYEDARKELFVLKNEMQRSKKLEKPHLLRMKRKEIARLLTVVHEKQSKTQQRAN